MFRARWTHHLRIAANEPNNDMIKESAKNERKKTTHTRIYIKRTKESYMRARITIITHPFFSDRVFFSLCKHTAQHCTPSMHNTTHHDFSWILYIIKSCTTVHRISLTYVVTNMEKLEHIFRFPRIYTLTPTPTHFHLLYIDIRGNAKEKHQQEKERNRTFGW